MTMPTKAAKFQNLLRVLREVRDRIEHTPHLHEDDVFNMKTWTADWPTSTKKYPTCGTAACAIGHCCFDPWFQAQGFHFDLSRYIVPRSFVPTFGTLTGFEAITDFFAIPYTHAHELFGAKSATLETVIAQISEYMALYHLHGVIDLPDTTHNLEALP